MRKMMYRRHRLLCRLALFLAAMPLLQVSQCQTFQRQVLATALNNLPATLFQVFQGFALLPIQILLGGGNVGQGGLGGLGGGGFNGI